MGSPRGSVSVCRPGEAGKEEGEFWPVSGDPQAETSFRMLRLLLCSTVFLCLIVPAPAPFAKTDPRSIFNFLIEPWWCLVPRIVRELLHLKYFGTPLNEVGPCSLKADGSSSSPEPEPEGEPESEPYAEPEPRNPRRRPSAEPEAEPRNGRLRTEPVPEPEQLSPEPESAPEKLSPESALELMQILEEQAALRARLESLLGSGPRPEPEPEPEAESEPERPRGSSVPVVMSREPHHKVYFIES